VRVDERHLGDDAGQVNVLVVIEVPDAVMGQSQAREDGRTSEKPAMSVHGVFRSF
jgi:hypothetical protein